MQRHHTAEQWLYALSKMLRPWFREAGLTIPANVVLARGSPMVQRDGETYYGKATETGKSTRPHEIFISAHLSDPMAISLVVTHELIHSCLDRKILHGKEFQNACRRVGLVMVSPDGRTEIDEKTQKGRELRIHLAQTCLVELGDYPRSAMYRPRPAPKKPRRSVGEAIKPAKLQCPSCRYIISVGPASLAKNTPPLCGNTECERYSEPFMTPELGIAWRAKRKGASRPPSSED